MQGYFDEYGNWIEGPMPEDPGIYEPPPPPVTTNPLFDSQNRPKDDPGPGNYWSWNGTQWEIKPLPPGTVGSNQPPPGGAGDTPPPGGGGGMSEAEGRAYDEQNGLVGGYMGPNGWVHGSPRSTPGGTGGPTGGGGGDWGYLTEPFTGTAPAWQGFTPGAAPEIVRPPAFGYKEFVMPTTDSIYADPSYKFRFGEGQKALEQNAAGRGVLRTGGTLKDFINYGQNAASQEYGNIVDRAVNVHNLGLQQALGTYATNWGVGRDVLDREIDIWGAKNTLGQRENELSNRRNLDAFLAEFDIFDRNRKRAADVLFGAANVGSANA